MLNDFPTPTAEYYPRWLADELRLAARDHRVLVLTGARQTGKSTLLLNEPPFNGWRFITLDDLDALALAKEDPHALWAGEAHVILDEVQRAPELLLAVKRAVDEGSGPRTFVLSGSANLLLMRQVSETLAGRAVYFVLGPMTLGELRRAPPPTSLRALLAGIPPEVSAPPPSRESLLETLQHGLLPAVLKLDDPRSWVRWWTGYVSTYLERDLRQVSQIDSLVDFRRVLELLAYRSGQLLNQSELARDARLSQPTVHRYLNLMETTHLFSRLPAWTQSGAARVLKAPKVMWSDPGLAVFLAGYYSAQALASARELGGFFEGLVHHHLQVLASLMAPPARLHFWRTQRGAEVDFVLQHGREILGIEVKLRDTVRLQDAAGLRQLQASHGEPMTGIVLYTGAQVQPLGERLFAVPLSVITG